jgi:hypothetical protein
LDKAAERKGKQMLEKTQVRLLFLFYKAAARKGTQMLNKTQGPGYLYR